MRKILFFALFLIFFISSVDAKVIATVNGYPITLKEANALVKKITRGKATYSKLKPADKKKIIKALATDKLVMETATRSLSKREKSIIWVDAYVRKHYKEILAKAKKDLTVREKKIANADFWIRKKASRIKVTEAEMKKAYKKNKRFFKNRKTGKIAPYSKVKPILRMEIQKQKFLKQLMKKAKINYNPKASTAKK
jgi:hypothetical protein